VEATLGGVEGVEPPRLRVERTIPLELEERGVDGGVLGRLAMEPVLRRMPPWVVMAAPGGRLLNVPKVGTGAEERVEDRFRATEEPWERFEWPILEGTTFGGQCVGELKIGRRPNRECPVQRGRFHAGVVLKKPTEATEVRCVTTGTGATPWSG
jgi:hypothetical protein